MPTTTKKAPASKTTEDMLTERAEEIAKELGRLKRSDEDYFNKLAANGEKRRNLEIELRGIPKRYHSSATTPPSRTPATRTPSSGGSRVTSALGTAWRNRVTVGNILVALGFALGAVLVATFANHFLGQILLWMGFIPGYIITVIQAIVVLLCLLGAYLSYDNLQKKREEHS